MVALADLRQSQPRVAAVLSAALASNRWHHAYLLVGPEPQAAELLVRATARALVCERPSASDGCGECPACRKLEAGNHPDVITVSPNDKGIISIEQVRDAAARLSLKASEAKTKVVHIASADLMNAPAQNALLKTLEEPPGPTCFFLSATRLRALLPTVRSRCLTLRLAPQDRLHSWEVLEQGGISAEVARALGPIIGGDQTRAAELVEQGAGEVLAALREAASEQLPPDRLFSIAADLGQNRDRADLALALLELAVRDALARRHGAQSELLYDPAVRDLGHVPATALVATVARLQELRRLVALHINRTLALEGALGSLRRAQTEGA